MNYSRYETHRDAHARNVLDLFDRADDLTTIVHVSGKHTGVAPWEYYAAMALEVLADIARTLRQRKGAYTYTWNLDK